MCYFDYDDSTAWLLIDGGKSFNQIFMGLIFPKMYSSSFLCHLLTHL